VRLADPWLLLLLLVPVALGFWRRRRRGPAALISAAEIPAAAGRTWRTRLRGLPGALRLAAIALLAVGLARPQAGFGVVRTSADGVAIMMVLDRSSSMNGAIGAGSSQTTRFIAAQNAFSSFVLGDGRTLEGRPHDLVGMIAFARYPETIAPLSRATDAVAALASSVNTAEQRAEDGTAIGDAVALAAARLRNAEKNLAERNEQADDDEEADPDFTIKSKVIILLTDGENNAGDADPIRAARLAAEWGIKIYAVGITGDRSITLPGGQRRRLPGSGADDGVLRRLAESTGGFYRPVEDAGALRAVYEEIDQLEKTEIRTREYTNYDERFPPIILAALAALALEGALRLGPLRRPL